MNMKIIDFLLSNLLPVLSAVLCSIATLKAIEIVRNSHLQGKDIHSNKELYVKINNYEMKLEYLEEEKAIQVLKKLDAEQRKKQEEKTGQEAKKQEKKGKQETKKKQKIDEEQKTKEEKVS